MTPLRFIGHFITCALVLGALLVFVDTALHSDRAPSPRYVFASQTDETPLPKQQQRASNGLSAPLRTTRNSFSLSEALHRPLAWEPRKQKPKTSDVETFNAIEPSAASQSVQTGQLAQLDTILAFLPRPRERPIFVQGAPPIDWSGPSLDKQTATPSKTKNSAPDAILSGVKKPDQNQQTVEVIYLNEAGYAALADRADDAALTYFRKSLLQDPNQPLIQSQVGYILKSIGRYSDAGTAFTHAASLGVAAARPGIAREASTLRRPLRFTGYTVWREDSRPEADISFGPSLAQSQSGLGVSYRLPFDGWASKHDVSAYARLLWAYQPMSLRINDESFQGGLGVQMRPFQSFNFIAAAERLVSFGQDARDDWLLRGSYSAGQGYAPLNYERSWIHWSLYADAAVIDPMDPDLQITGEGRFGFGQRPFEQSSFTIIPFAGLSANFQDAAGMTTTLYEAGAGMWMRYWPGGPNIDDPLRSLDLRLEYRGKLGGDSQSTSGLRITLGLNY